MYGEDEYTVEQVYQGFYRVEWTREEGQAGMPWAAGVLQLEHHPDLDPLSARGVGTDPGKYWRDQYNPHFWSATRRVIRAVSGLEYRIEKPELPEWATEEDLAAHARQWALHQRVWWRLTRRRVELVNVVREILATAITSGFYWAEHVCDPVVMTIPETGLMTPAVWLLPQWPKWRAPWTVRYWLTQREKPVGVIADFSQAVDWQGSHQSSWSVLPWTKIVHVASEAVGSNLEGVSWQRPINNLVEMIQEMWRIQALGAEIGAIGEPVVTQPETNVDEDDADDVDAWILNRRSGQGGGIQLPFGWKLDMTKPSESMPDLDKPITGLARDLLMTLDAEDRSIAATGDVGAFAARESASDDARAGWDYIATAMVVPVFEDIFRVAVQANFPADAAAGRYFLPTIATGPLSARDTGKWLEAVIAAYSSGILADPTLGPQVASELDLQLAEAVTDTGATAGVEEPIDDGQWLTPAEIAQRWAYSPGSISGWIRSGRLKGRKIGSRWRARAADVALFLEDKDADNVPDGVDPDGQAAAAAAVQIAASEIMASEDGGHRERLAVMIPVPAEVGDHLPCDKPHVTLVYVADVGDRRDEALAVVYAIVAEKGAPFRVDLGQAQHLINPKGHVVFYSRVGVEWDVYELRGDVVRGLQAEGFAVSFPDDWTPHLTLKVDEDPRASFVADHPQASFFVDHLEIWGDGNVEKIKLTAGGKP